MFLWKDSLWKRWNQRVIKYSVLAHDRNWPRFHWSMGVFPQKNSLIGLYLVGNHRDPFVWSQAINSHKASFSGIPPVETHNNRIIITIYRRWLSVQEFPDMVEAEFYLGQCVQSICVCVRWKSDFLIPHKINRLNRFFCGNTPNNSIHWISYLWNVVLWFSQLMCS